MKHKKYGTLTPYLKRYAFLYKIMLRMQEKAHVYVFIAHEKNYIGNNVAGQKFTCMLGRHQSPKDVLSNVLTFTKHCQFSELGRCIFFKFYVSLL